MSRDIIDNDAVWRKITSDLRALEGKSVDIGVIGSEAAKDHDGLTNVELAAKHEFGVGVPRRSFIAQGWDANILMIEKFAGKVTDSVFSMGNYNVALNRLGLVMRQGVMDQFSKSGDPKWKENSQMTIAKKGSDKPLIDTGRLRQSVTFRIST